MEWTSPSMALGLLPLVLLCGVLVWRGRAAVAGTRLVGLLLLGALADPSLSQPNEPSRVVFLARLPASPSSCRTASGPGWKRSVQTCRPTVAGAWFRSMARHTRHAGARDSLLRAAPRIGVGAHRMREGIQQAAALLPMVRPDASCFGPMASSSRPLAADLDALAARGITVEVERPDIPAPADLRRLVLPEVVDVGSTAAARSPSGGPSGSVHDRRARALLFRRRVDHPP